MTTKHEGARCASCGKGHVYWDSGCAAHVCDSCSAHHINYPSVAARCWCGWSASGGNGRAELLDMGEVLDEDY